MKNYNNKIVNLLICTILILISNNLLANNITDNITEEIFYNDFDNIDNDELIINNIDTLNLTNNTKDLAYLDQESLESYQEPKKIKSDQKDINNQEDKNDKLVKPKATDNAEVDSKKQILETEVKEYDDPYEHYNRFMYGVNKFIDRYTLKPIAHTYNYVMPPPASHMVTNFFEHVQDITVLANTILQLDYDNTVRTIGRLILNSSFGVLGLIDVATDVGLPKITNDYGVTLGKWGMQDSPYFVIPFMGPSTVRDTIGKGLAFATSVGFYFPDEYAWPLTGLYIIDTRANLITAEKIVDTVADEEYIFVRNSYLQYRDSLINGEKRKAKREQQEEVLIDAIVDDEEADKQFDDKLKKLQKLSEDLFVE